MDRDILAADRRWGVASYVALTEAREHLDELLDRAENGEEIVISREGRTGIGLVPAPATEPIKARRVGGQNLLGITYIAPDFDADLELNSVPVRRTLAECVVMLDEHSHATIDEDFARDVAAGVEARREPIDASAWD